MTRWKKLSYFCHAIIIITRLTRIGFTIHIETHHNILLECVQNRRKNNERRDFFFAFLFLKVTISNRIKKGYLICHFEVFRFGCVCPFRNLFPRHFLTSSDTLEMQLELMLNVRVTIINIWCAYSAAHRQIHYSQSHKMTSNAYIVYTLHLRNSGCHIIVNV